MFDGPVGRTFSDIWYRVGPTRPKLSAHARFTRQRHGRRVHYIVEDPASGQYYRLSDSAYFFVGLLDGRRTVDAAWEACCAQLGDDAPTQNECVDLLSRLQMFGLLAGESPLAPDMVEQRARMSAASRVKRRTGNFTSPSIPLWNPEPVLERSKHIVKLLFSPVGAVAWVLLVGAGLIALASNWGAFTSELQLGRMLDPRSLATFGVIFVILRAVHELGHAAACKAMGGRSTEIGLLMIAGVLPLPYCDATSAWRLPEIWRRVLVSAAGVLAETPIAAVAALLWAYGDAVSNPIVHDAARQIIIVSGVSTLVFNLNPLLRYDGYYILSDVLGIPNLSQRSRDVLKHLVERRAFGVRSGQPPQVRSRTEAWILLVYALLATPYRLFVMFSIVMLIAMQYRELGVALGVVAAAVWLVWPVLKGAAYLLTSPKLMGRRGRALAVTGATLASIALLLGVIPMPAAGYAWGTIEPAAQVTLRAGESGFIEDIRFTPGEDVPENAVVFVFSNPELKTRLDQAQARVRFARSLLNQAIAEGPSERDVAQSRLRAALEEERQARERVDALTIRSPIAGRLVAAEGAGLALENIEGRFVRRGAVLAEVATTRDLVVRASVSDTEYGYVFSGGRTPEASVRVKGRGGDSRPASVARIVRAGSREVHSAALTSGAGGDAVLDPEGQNGRRTLDVRFPVEIAPVEPIPGAQPGLRARVRFEVEPEPLASQWLRKARQFFATRLGV